MTRGTTDRAVVGLDDPTGISARLDLELQALQADRAVDADAPRSLAADRPQWPLAYRDVPRRGLIAPADEPWSNAIAAGILALIVAIVFVAWTSVQ